MYNPVSERRRSDVDTTLYRRQQRCYDVETTSCVYWETIIYNPFNKNWKLFTKIVIPPSKYLFWDNYNNIVQNIWYPTLSIPYL